MKRFTLIVAVSLMVASLGGAAEVTSINKVGFKTMTVRPDLNLLAYNWNQIGSAAEIDVQDVMDTSSLQSGGGSGSADNLALWDEEGQVYIRMFLYDGKWDAGKANKWVYNDKSIATNRLARGEGMWLKRVGGQTEITLKGEVPEAASTVHGFPGDGELALFGSGYSADVDINSLDWSTANNGGGSGSADNLALWDSESQTYVRMFLYDGKWDAGKANKWVYNDKTVATNLLKLGEGAWYRRPADETSAYLWTQDKPY